MSTLVNYSSVKLETNKKLPPAPWKTMEKYLQNSKNSEFLTSNFILNQTSSQVQW